MKCLITKLINYLLKGTELMTAAEDIVNISAKADSLLASNAAMGEVVNAMDLTLDQVAANIQNLIKNSAGLSAEQLQMLQDASAKLSTLQGNVDTVKTHLDAVETEATSLTSTPPTP